MPGGRPSKLTQIVRQRPDGTPVTAGDEYIERIRLGLSHDQAAASANLDRRTTIRWRQQAAAARQKQLRNQIITAREADLIEFCHNLERAEADAETSRLGVIERAAMGGAVVSETHETSKLVNGTMTVTERRTVTKTLRPEWTAAAWWLERRLPQRYARRVELSGPGGAPIAVEDRARELADELRAFQLGADAALEVSQSDEIADTQSPS